MLSFYVFGSLAFAIVIAVFAVQNTTPVSVSFVVWRLDSLAVSVLVLISAALGAALMLLLSLWREVRMRLQARSLGQELRAAQARVRELESAPPTTTITETTETTVPILPSPGQGTS